MDDLIKNEAFYKTIRRQIAVANPDVSAFVSANAGSGKTKVLTDRVIRLLLTGAPPATILCITFTKAAAAEMAERLFKVLGEWSLQNDTDLSKNLTELLGIKQINPEKLPRARRLFAQALETPGGLKIQTIHAFCENILRRFPVECGLLPGFSVITEEEEAQIFEDCLNRFSQSIHQRPEETRAAYDALTLKYNEEQLAQNITTLLRSRNTINRFLGTPPQFDRLAEPYEADPDKDSAQFISDFLNAIDETKAHHLVDALSDLMGVNEIKLREALLFFLENKEDTQSWKELLSILLTKEFQPPKHVPSKPLRNKDPDIASWVETLQQQAQSTINSIHAFEAFQLCRSLHKIAFAIAEDYSAQKHARGLIDFDALIKHTLTLFENNIDWVLYKLDYGLQHILIDEAQDTSASQWAVITNLMKEFFAGKGVSEKLRTAFVVGDHKQSIYSFQGANVALFEGNRQWLKEKTNTVKQIFVDEQLDHSFRSTTPILSFVDEVFKDEHARIGVCHTGETLHHTSARAQTPGLVELWPPAWAEKGEAEAPWDLPVDLKGRDEKPAAKIATAIAGQIKSWLGQRFLPSRGRTVEAGDILILCQRRGPVFLALIRELSRQDIPCSGTDRLKLLDDIAVKDLIVLMQFCLQQNDDLSLAEFLKSPFIGFDDKTLTDIAYDRGTKSLWQALQEKKPETAAFLQSLITISMSEGPYALFSTLLDQGRPTGWQNLYQRLGATSEEALQEFLDEVLSFETSHTASTLAFLHHCRTLDNSIKKELSEAKDFVRVMTVHGAKGLQAPIVFVADAGYRPGADRDSFVQTEEAVPLYKPLTKQRPAAITRLCDAKEEMKTQEYRRLLYVALTRAADELYICAHTDRNKTPQDWLDKQKDDKTSWYKFCHTAMKRLEQNKGSGDFTVESQKVLFSDDPIMRYHNHKATKAVTTRQEEKIETKTVMPDWLWQQPTKETLPRFYSPSGGASDSHDTHPVLAPEINATAKLSPRERGNLIHSLLERLGDLPTNSREGAGEKLIALQTPDLAPEEASEYLMEALHILSNPALAALFGPQSAAEVTLAGPIISENKTIHFSGQIDRLAILDNEILIADYKTNRPPPKDKAEIPTLYAAQMAAYKKLLAPLYPDKTIRCALLWTVDANLMEVPATLMEQSFTQHFGSM
jgi:ATP-dependent helicase/nuclease subunit A